MLELGARAVPNSTVILKAFSTAESTAGSLSAMLGFNLLILFLELRLIHFLRLDYCHSILTAKQLADVYATLISFHVILLQRQILDIEFPIKRAACHSILVQQNSWNYAAKNGVYKSKETI
jgi:hypothetical protein